MALVFNCCERSAESYSMAWMLSLWGSIIADKLFSLSYCSFIFPGIWWWQAFEHFSFFKSPFHFDLNVLTQAMKGTLWVVNKRKKSHWNLAMSQSTQLMSSIQFHILVLVKVCQECLLECHWNWWLSIWSKWNNIVLSVLSYFWTLSRCVLQPSCRSPHTCHSVDLWEIK